MEPLGRFIDRARFRALIVVAIGWLFPPALFVSAGAAALTVLRRSVWDGLLVVTGAAVLLAAMISTGARGTESLALLLAPVLAATLMADLLKRGSLALVLSVSALAIFATVCALNALLEDPLAFWQAWVRQTLEIIAERPSVDLTSREIDEVVASPIWARMSALLGVSTMLTAWGGLFLARHWQASLVNPGGFQREFHGLSLGRNASIVTMALFCAVVLTGSVWLVDAAVFALFLWMIQGLAFIHWLCGPLRQGVLVLTGLYMALVMAFVTANALIVVAVPLLGITAELFGLRQVLRSRG